MRRLRASTHEGQHARERAPSLESNLTAKQQAAELFEKGYGYKAISSQLGLNQETVRDWAYTWRALGTQELLRQFEGKPFYPPKVKIAVAKDRIAGMNTIKVMKKHKIHSRQLVKRWTAAYKEKGKAAFGSTRKRAKAASTKSAQAKTSRKCVAKSTHPQEHPVVMPEGMPAISAKDSSL